MSRLKIIGARMRMPFSPFLTKAQLAPGVKPGDVAGVVFLRIDQHHVVEAIAVESRHRPQIPGEGCALALLQRGDELPEGLIGDLFDLLRFHVFCPFCVRAFRALHRG